MSTAVVMTGLAIADAANQGYSNYQLAKGQSKSYKEEARRLKENAAQTYMEGSINEDRTREQNRQTLSKMRAAIGEMGMSESATAIGSLSQDAAAAEQNALDIRYKTNTEANNYIQAASDSKFMSKQARTQGKNKFVMNLLQGAGNSVATYYKYSNPVDTGAIKNDNSWLWGK